MRGFVNQDARGTAATRAWLCVAVLCFPVFAAAYAQGPAAKTGAAKKSSSSSAIAPARATAKATPKSGSAHFTVGPSAQKTNAIKKSAAAASTRSGPAARTSVRSAPASRRTPVRQRASWHPAQLTPTADRYKEIQQQLTDKGYFHGTVDGQWGPDSVDALKRFQTDQKLEADGKLGALSLMALGLGPKRDAAAMAGVAPAASRPSAVEPTAAEPPAAVAEPAIRPAETLPTETVTPEAGSPETPSSSTLPAGALP